MFEATIEYLRGDTVVEIIGELIPVSGPFTGFWVIKWGDKHLCINDKYVISVQGDIPDIFVVDTEKISKSREMDRFMFDEEYQRMTKGNGDTDVFS